jgi:hypothetical protein
LIRGESLQRAACTNSPHQIRDRPQAPAASVLRTASLKAFLGLRSASAWSRQPGKSDDLKEIDSAGSVRVDNVLFIVEMVDLHSFFGADEGVSHRG